MNYVVETITKDARTKVTIPAVDIIAAEDLVKKVASKNGESVLDVRYGDMNGSGVSVIETKLNSLLIERRIYLSKNQN